MTAAAVDALAAVQALGGEVMLASPGRLRVVAPAPLPNELIERLRAAKPDLLRLLRETRPPDTWTDAHEERAAIAEYDGGATRAWAEALARLDPARPPADVPADRWLQFINDAGSFLDGDWGAHAEALGWGPLDLFGCDRERPLANSDRDGLVWHLRGGKLVAISICAAIMRTSTGQKRVLQRRNNYAGELALAWELARGST